MIVDKLTEGAACTTVAEFIDKKDLIIANSDQF